MPNGDVTPDSLIRAIETVQEAIRHDGRTIGANETRTRNTLIDPLLKALGWADPSVLTQEYVVNYQEYAKNRAIGNKSFRPRLADYALHQQDNPGRLTAFIEAKKMRDDLTDGDRDQVLGYAKERNVQHFILTNGDRWELYELNEGQPRKLIELSIRRQSASDCARLLLRHFPMLKKPSGEENLEPVDALPTLGNSAGTVPHPLEASVVSSRRVTNQADVPKVLTWLGVSLVATGILGWGTGVWKSQRIEGFFEYIGLYTVAFGIIIATALVWRFRPSAVPILLNILQLKRLFAPVNGSRGKNLMWVIVAIVCGIGLGGVGGHLIGLQTGQAVANVLKTLGQVVVVIAIIAIVSLIALEASRDSGKRRRGR